MAKEIIIEDVLIEGQWYPEAELLVHYTIEPAEKGLKDKYGQLITPNFGTTLLIHKVEFEGDKVKLTTKNMLFLYEQIEKELELC